MGDVIKIELPEKLAAGNQMGGARHGSDFQNLHRNKRSLSLNLKDPDGLKIGRTATKTNGKVSGAIPALLCDPIFNTD